MSKKDNLPEFDLNDILKEFSDHPESVAPLEDTNSLGELLEAMNAASVPNFDEELLETMEPVSLPEEVPAAMEPLQMSLEDVIAAAPAAQEASDAPSERETAAAPTEQETSEAPAEQAEQVPAEPMPDAPEASEAPVPTEEKEAEQAVPADAASETPEEKTPEKKPVIPFNRRTQLQELKKKLIAGPEKRYYDLTELGVTKLQIGMILNLIILGLCVAAAVLFTMGKVPVYRVKLMIFSQALALLGSGLLGCHLMLDGLEDLLHFRFTVDTLLAITFGACLADVYFCFQELRVPCCAAFSLEMIMAMLARYHSRSTEMAQMDTLRKAVRLIGIVKEPDYYQGKPAVLHTEGDLEDFLDTYSNPSGPQKAVNVYAVISVLICIGIAVLAGILHSGSMAVQIFATSLLVAVPASTFVSQTRPAALLEKRLHMVGTVICGWHGVKKLCGRAFFPLKDEDLFPQGSTKLNGVKFYSDRTPEEIISYTASLIGAAGGGLVGVFRNLLASRGGREYPVVNFRDYGSGGIGGEVCNEPVLLGTLDFLQDMGVEIPKGTMVNQAVYAAIDGQLAAVVAISYAKMRSSAAGLVSLIGCRRIKPLLLAGDFMLTEDFIRSKFGIRTRRLVVPEKDERRSLMGKTADPEADVLALATRTDLISYVYAVTGAAALRTACRLGALIHILGGLCGITIMAALAYLGTFELLTPINVLLYQLVWLVPGWLATEWTRSV